MSNPIDCRIIEGDVPVMISRSTAEYALQAINEKADRGGYRMMLADDASFLRAGIRELERAIKRG